MEPYIKIKAFAELTGVSVRTLQYYDEINLLKPEYLDAHGHRFYGAASFSTIFIVLSLKKMGMHLREIQQYLQDNRFDLRVYIDAEKRRVEAELTELQLRLIRLSRLNEALKEEQEITPALLPLLSQLASNTNVTETQMTNWLKKSVRTPAFNLKDWDSFIKDLNHCYANKLTAKDKKAIWCIRYWKKNVLEAHQIDADMVTFAEGLYQKNPGPAFGMTAATYTYLMKLMQDEHDA